MSCLALMALAVTLAAPQAAPPARKHVAPIIPRDVLFGNPDRTRVRISPDGTHLGYLAARDGVLNVFVQDVKDGKLTGEPKAVTKSTSRPIRDWSFVPGASQVLYLRDEGGNENFQLFAVDLASGEEKCLTPWPGSRAEILDLDRDHPHEVLVSVNNRDPSVFDAWKIDTVSGKGEMVFQNDRGFLGVLPDGDWKIRFGSLMTPEGELESYCRDANGGDWKLFQKWPFEDSGTSNALGISRDGQSVFVVDSSVPRPGTRAASTK